MVIKTTLWSPDTCGCQFEYEWDDTQSEDIRIHSFKSVAKECASHAHLTGNGKKDMYDSSLEENRRRNGTIEELLDKAAAEFGELDPESGTITLKKDIIVSWNWSGIAPDRILTITVTGITLTPPRRNQIQNFLNTRFGTNKVVFVN